MKVRRFANIKAKEAAIVPYINQIENQRKLITDEVIEQIGKRVSGQISMLIWAFKSTEKWLRLCEEVLSNAIEFLNICQILDRDKSILKTSLNVISQLWKLESCIENSSMDGYVYPELENIKDIIEAAGHKPILQDDSEWFDIKKWDIDFEDKLPFEYETGLEKRLLDFEMSGEDLLPLNVECSNDEEAIKKMCLMILKETLKTINVISPAIVQRKFDVGYTRSNVLIREMAKMGFVEKLKDNADTDERIVYITVDEVNKLLNELNN